MLPANEIKLIRSLSDKKFRDRTGLFIVEGEKLVDEAVHSGFIVEKIYRRDEIGDAAMQRISATASGSPVLALVRKPLDIRIEAEDTYRNALGDSGLFIALDSIRDPGNLGTILRIADWFNVKAVFASPDTVDIFNPKVVQATMGAIFRVKFHYASIPLLCDIVRDCGGEVYGTFLDGADLYRQELECGIGKPSLIVIGNESNGISDEVGAKATGRLLIPRYKENGSESLNAAIATAITVAEFRRRSADGLR